jgi:pyruvate/2-oxoacid:ferredoxin oxidoreductase alpha subunit
VESEHSALQVVVSASGLGARTYTATSSHGLLLMHELVHWASGARDPIVMGVINRAVGPPWNIGADHTDTMSQRDTGWVQFYAESNQEVLDTVLMAFRLAEHPDVRLPVMVTEDAFYLSHTLETVDVPEQGVVDGFLPPREPHATLVPGTASRLGSFTGPDRYVDFRREAAKAMERVPTTLLTIEDEFRRATGRSHGGAVPTYRIDDADAVLFTMGTSTSTARMVVDDLRSQGKKVGLAKLRLFRPFPNEEVRTVASAVDRIGVADRSYTFGPMGAAATEVSAALYPASHRPAVTGFYAGVGGRDVTPHLVRRMYDTLLSGEVPEVHWEDIEEEVSVDG